MGHTRGKNARLTWGKGEKKEWARNSKRKRKKSAGQKRCPWDQEINNCLSGGLNRCCANEGTKGVKGVSVVKRQEKKWGPETQLGAYKRIKSEKKNVKTNNSTLYQKDKKPSAGPQRFWKSKKKLHQKSTKWRNRTRARTLPSKEKNGILREPRRKQRPVPVT